MLRVHLKVVGGKHDGKLIPLSTKKFLVGREKDCNLRPNSESVSRHHCVFTLDEFSVLLRDLGSTNGTFVNDAMIRGQRQLESGDIVVIGNLRFEMIIKQTEVAAAPAPAAPDSDYVPAKLVEPDQTEAVEQQQPHEETIQIAASASETIAEIPALPPSETVNAETPQPIESPTIQHPAAQVAPEQQQPVYSGDTTFMPAQQQPPGGYPPGMYPPPPYPGMEMHPGYAQAPMGYPYPYPPQYPPPYGGQMMPYPQQPGMPPGYPLPGQMPAQQPPAPQQPAAGNDGANKKAHTNIGVVDPLPVRLPKPEETGVSPEELARQREQAQLKAAQSAAGDKVSPSNMAADIIRSYMTRRAAGEEAPESEDDE